MCFKFLSLLVLGLTTASAITIPVTSSTGTSFSPTVDSPSTLQQVLAGTYTALNNNTVDANWSFVRYATLAGATVNNPSTDAATVYRPASNPVWFTDAPNGETPLKSSWISATGLTNKAGTPPNNAQTGYYYGYSEFTLGAGTWWTVFDGRVWGSDIVTEVDLYKVNGTTGSVVSSVFLGSTIAEGAAGALWGQSRTFSIREGGLGPGTYRLRFHFVNQDSGLDYAGIRVEFDQGMHYATPEPMSSALMLTAGAGLVFAAVRRRRKPTASA